MTLADVLAYLALWVGVSILVGALWVVAHYATRRRRRP